MRLTKKHVGQLFDVRGSDGSWAYLLLDIKKGENLFYCLTSGRYEIEGNHYNDWRKFELDRFCHDLPFAWRTGRRS